MKLLAIETSCDETAIAILEAGGTDTVSFKVLGNALLSQIDIHRQYGGVFPAVAKREHAKNLVPLLAASLEEAELLHEDAQIVSDELRTELGTLLEREPGLGDALLDFLSRSEPPAIDAIAVTSGPGLEPALWVGINFAKALSRAWNVPIVPVNHMEGHLLASLVKNEEGSLVMGKPELPVLALLISGGHTELVLMREWLKYELMGQTLDDAVGEAFDKVARMLGLPYPGGPEISRLAEMARAESLQHVSFTLPRPMLDKPNCDFSFSGLKTAVMYLLKGKAELSEDEKKKLAEEFENSVTEVLWTKTARAIDESGAKTVLIGGGVSANKNIRRVFAERIAAEYPHVELRIPTRELSTDNAVMIGIAGYFRIHDQSNEASDIRANGTLSL